MEQDVRNLVQELEARWKSLTIANDFVFGKVMLDEDLCKDVLEAILATDIEKIEYVGRQDAIDVTEDGHGVRLDVYVRDDRGTVYSVEMQATNTHELPQRSRYYHAMLALSQIGKGAPYRSLRDSYVIFICGFDLFGQGRRVYSFQSRCEDDPDLCLNDGVHTIFLAATSPTEPQEGPRVNELLDYISSRKVTGELSSRLNEAVEHVLDNRKWRLEFMMQAIKDQLNVDKGRELGLEEGRKLGLEEGRQLGLDEGRKLGLDEGHKLGLDEGHKLGLEEGQTIGEERFAKLVARLNEDGRQDDIVRAATDPAFRANLFSEYSIGLE
ncbi:MAG: Rpn family recombination-promoting nuclease/putative transposase [Parafannyhessea umbonata]|nr:Rpn family recombination-promoting nuclease/putative transposase [Parafannyhessea umbonata]